MPSAMCLLSTVNQVDVEQRPSHLAIVAVLGDLLWQPPYRLCKHKQVPKAEPMLSKERLIAQQCRFVGAIPVRPATRLTVSSVSRRTLTEASTRATTCIGPAAYSESPCCWGSRRQYLRGVVYCGMHLDACLVVVVSHGNNLNSFPQVHVVPKYTTTFFEVQGPHPQQTQSLVVISLESSSWRAPCLLPSDLWSLKRAAFRSVSPLLDEAMPEHKETMSARFH